MVILLLLALLLLGSLGLMPWWLLISIRQFAGSCNGGK